MSIFTSTIQAVEDQVVGAGQQGTVDIEASAARFDAMVAAKLAAANDDVEPDYRWHHDLGEVIWERGEWVVSRAD